jgi:hypothetical protein
VETAINCIRSELGETIKIGWKTSWRQDQWTQGLREELNAKIEETQLFLQAVTTSFDTQTKKDLQGEFHCEIETTRCEFETQLKEVEAQVVQGVSGNTGTDAGSRNTSLVRRYPGLCAITSLRLCDRAL